MNTHGIKKRQPRVNRKLVEDDFIVEGDMSKVKMKFGGFKRDGVWIRVLQYAPNSGFVCIGDEEEPNYNIKFHWND